jgi:uracil-DNA glycosylase family 4
MTRLTIRNSKTALLKDIIGMLEFYQALGFERLPIAVKKGSSMMGRPSKRSLTQTGTMKAHALKALREEIGDCKLCKLANKRTHIVFGEGDPHAMLMFIGEGPGREEDMQGRPFIGDAGMLLTRLIEKMGLTRGEVYIANIVKCRPPMNRDPEIDEIETCRGFLEKQIEIIEPQVIMTLGRIAAQTLMDNTKARITSIRGKFFDYKGIPVMPTFHPAYLIRNPKAKWLTWDDAQKVVEQLSREE